MRSTKTGFQSRALDFTEHGIDIVDASGVPLRPYELWEEISSPATVARWAFKSKNGQLLQELWEAVRSELGYELPEDRVKGAPPRRNGLGLVPSNSGIETPKQNRPPHLKDANFLLYQFLNERFPEGGVFRTASRVKDENSTDDLREFVRFCKRPANLDHPYSAKWLELLDRPRPLVSILACNIRVYRTCESQKTSSYSVRLRHHFNETIFHLGPPDSAEKNVVLTDA